MESLQARLSFAGFAVPDLHGTLRELCDGLQSFVELQSAAERLLPMIEASVDAKRLHALAPASLRLGNGRQTKVHYEQGKPPWIASRLQDFFGMQETPRIGPERSPVVIHLLAPNQRAVQTTMDLAGFWERLYPQVRRELMRRYPRHAWPETPTAVQPAKAR
jgi:ATP-dependent helicase HrpB